MFKKSFLIGVLIIGMTVVMVSDSLSLTCSRCRRSPWAICYEEILAKIKDTFKVDMAGIAKISIINLSLGGWYNPAGQFQAPPEGNPHEFYAPFDITAIDLFKADPLEKARWAYDRKYWPECELWDLYFCADPDDMEEVCYKNDVDGNCEEYVWVCPANSYYDYSKLPPEAYWSNGQDDKWTPAQIPCNPSIFPLGDPDGPGGFFVELMWVESFKRVCTLDKKTGVETCVDEPLDAVCLELELVDDGDRIEYNRVEDCECIGPCQ